MVNQHTQCTVYFHKKLSAREGSDDPHCIAGGLRLRSGERIPDEEFTFHEVELALESRHVP